MSRRLFVRKAAEDDIEEAARWYETQREGLGIEFTSSVGKSICLPSPESDTASQKTPSGTLSLCDLLYS